MDSFEDWLEFCRNENPKPCVLKCHECGAPADGNLTVREKGEEHYLCAPCWNQED